MQSKSTLTCQFCGLESTPDSDLFQIDKFQQGFWCEDCDGYTYINDSVVRHRFKLIYEEKQAKNAGSPRPNKKFRKRLSPYRYPGGKSKMIDYLYTHLQQSKTKVLVSPFTGGGSFELAMLDAGIVKHLHLNDLDTGVYSLWWVIKHMPFVLIDRIESIEPSHEDFFRARSLILNDYQGADVIDAAWASLLVNRLSYSGIPKANPLGGKNGSKKVLLSRWNPFDLISRIERIHAMSDKIEVTNLDAKEVIEEAYWIDDATIFIDPPFIKKGQDLYTCYYSDEDHRELAFLLESLHFGFSGADIVLTYDYQDWLDQLYELPEKEKVNRIYSA